MKILNRKSIIFIVAGIVCVIVLLLFGNGSDEVKREENYEDILEQKLTELISGLDGVSEVKVMVVQECGAEYIYATDKELTEDREQIEYYSAGDEDALLIKEISPVIKGVAVVCNGTSSSKTKITELISSVLDIPMTRIFVDT
ncbi:MAG: hypothetical protein IKU19_07140 [Clostridia bacterium]|nr:hypothetical protein [Clostridia bacterium]